jgi:hypothetical protein
VIDHSNQDPVLISDYDTHVLSGGDEPQILGAQIHPSADAEEPGATVVGAV